MRFVRRIGTEAPLICSVFSRIIPLFYLFEIKLIYRALLESDIKFPSKQHMGAIQIYRIASQT